MNTDEKRKTDYILVTIVAACILVGGYLGWKFIRPAAARPGRPQLERGTTVPSLVAKKPDGSEATIDFRAGNKPTVIYVFSPSCVWCKRNTRNISAIARAKSQEFNFVGVSLSSLGLEEYLKDFGPGFPVYDHPSENSIQALALGVTPQTIVISPAGQVLQNWEGAFDASAQTQVEEFFNLHLPGLD